MTRGPIGRMITAGALLLALAGCGTEPKEASVELYHCGVEPLQFDGRFWEVPDPPPFDQLSPPPGWVGRGVVTKITDDTLTYQDQSGTVVTFIPGDGEWNHGCA